MLEAKTLHSVKMQLFAAQPATVFTILDGASVPDLPAHLASFNPEHVCLYRGELEPDMAEVAPYLAILEQNAPFTDWVIANGWGKHWGIFGTAPADLRSLRNHFRKFLVVHDPNGKSLYFRYYDPRVLRVYLPTCNRQELAAVFGAVSNFFLESEDEANAENLTFSNGTFRSEIVPLSL